MRATGASDALGSLNHPGDSARRAGGCSPLQPQHIPACSLARRVQWVAHWHPRAHPDPARCPQFAIQIGPTSWTLNHTNMALALFSSVCFTLLGRLLSGWPPTRTAGKVLVGRVKHTVRNWETETLRSFIELTTWLTGIWLVYDKTRRPFLAILCGTMSGWVLVLCGEALTPMLREVEKHMRQTCTACERSPHRPARLGPARAATLVDPILYLLYGISGTQLIYRDIGDIAVAGLLAGLAGSALLASSKLIAAWPPTRRAGQILQDRILGTAANWRNHPARSATEACSFLGCTIGAYAQYNDMLQAVQAGLAAGMLVCLVSEALAGRWIVPTSVGEEDRSARLVPLGVCAYAVILGCHWAFAAGRHGFASQVLFTICCGATAEIAAKLFLSSKRTRKWGAAIQQRLTHTVSNWETRPLRSAVEVGWTNAATWATWHLSHNVHLTFVAGIASGMGVVYLSEKLLFPPARPQPQPQEAAASDRATDRATDVADDNDTAHRADEPAVAPAADTRMISHEELQRHSSGGDSWLAIHGMVYNVSRWHDRHPGGSDILLAYAGRDASDQFELFHPPAVARRLKPFLVGALEARRPPSTGVRWGLFSEPDEGPPGSSGGGGGGDGSSSRVGDGATTDYRKLRRQLWEEGAFEPDASFYWLKQAVVIGLWGTAVGVLLAATGSDAKPARGQILLSAALLALALQQGAFIGHDTLHNGVLARPRGRTWRRAALAQLNAGALLGTSSPLNPAPARESPVCHGGRPST